MATYLGLTDLVEKFLNEVDDDVNASLRFSVDPGYGLPALLLASRKGDTDTVRLLLEKEVNHLQTSGSENAMTLASWEGRDEILQLLIDFGVNVNWQPGKAWTAL